MKEEFLRTAMLLGDDGIKKLNQSTVAVFGLGGVGGYTVEALARAGVGHLVLTDSDTISVSNINRQLIALHSTVGMKKTEAFKERIKDINPDCKVTIHDCFYLPETAGEFDFSLYDYVVDAVDTVTAKLDIIMKSKDAGVQIISSMGAGNKLDPSLLRISDIYKTSVCPLAKVMRYELKKRGVKELKVVYSTETPIKPMFEVKTEGKRQTPGSVSFVPSVAGLLISSEVIKDLTKSLK